MWSLAALPYPQAEAAYELQRFSSGVQPTSPRSPSAFAAPSSPFSPGATGRLALVLAHTDKAP